MKNAFSASLIAVTALAACLLSGCSAPTDVSLGGNTPPQYSHVYVTTQDVWVNSSSTAGPDDGGWYKFTLSTPTTIDLVSVGGGNMAEIDDVRILAGTYSQIRVIPIDPSAALTTPASNLGAIYNSEADYVDSTGVTHQLPLEFLNPDKGLGIATSLKVPIGSIGAAVSGAVAGTSTTGTETTTGTTTGTTGTTIGSTTGTTIGSTGGSTSSSTSSQTANQFVISVNGATDLTPFTFSGTTGILLSQHATASDLSRSGGISGTLTLTNLTTATSGLPNIQVSAQTLSADGTRHVINAATTVQADGTFLLYPLAASTEGVYYDVVIHGPGIATIILKSVIVTLPSSSDSTSSTTATTLATTTGTTATSTGTTNTTANNVVDIGTLTPRSATAYSANMASAAKLPGGALLGFYQTLATSGSVPYIIESSPIDPLNKVLFTGQLLSTGTIDSGTWSSNGATVAVISAAPKEGAGNYIVSPYAPNFGDAALTTIVKAPAASTSTPATTPTTTFTAPALPLAASSASGTLHATITQTTPGKYNSGEVLVSSNGTLVGSAPLPAGFGSSTSVTVSGLPAQVSSAAYYVTVRAWNSSDPTAVARQWSDQLVDMRSATSGSVSINLD